MADIPPNQTLYVRNLNEKIKKEGTVPLSAPGRRWRLAADALRLPPSRAQS